MEALLKRYENINGQWVKIQSEKVTFLSITGTNSAKIIDSKGKERIVRRSSLINVPKHVLYPNIPVIGKCEPDPDQWKRACYFD